MGAYCTLLHERVAVRLMSCDSAVHSSQTLGGHMTQGRHSDVILLSTRSERWGPHWATVYGLSAKKESRLASSKIHR